MGTALPGPVPDPRSGPTSHRLHTRIGRSLQGLLDPRHRCGSIRDRSGHRRRDSIRKRRSAIPRSRPRVTLAPPPRSSSCPEGRLARSRDCAIDPIGYDVRLEAYGSQLALAAGWSERTPIVSTEPGVPPPADPIVTFWDRFDFAYRAELEAFLRVAKGEEAPACGPRDALENLRAAIACDRSVAEGRTVAPRRDRLTNGRSRLR